MEDKDLLLTEYKTFTEFFWKNEDIGEKRVDFFVTLTTAIIAGIIALITSEHTNFDKFDICLIATAALSGAFLLGLVTFLRILHRNRVTDEYKEIIEYLRKRLQKGSPSLSEYDLPFKSNRRLLRGGLAEIIAMMNSIVMAVIVALWFGRGWGWIAVVLTLLILFVFQVAVARKDRQKEESRSQTFRAGVGAIILSSNGKVLALERKDVPGSWQMPQGGIEIGESPLDAVKREIFEETGLRESELQLLSTASRLLAYELPIENRSRKTGRGQVQRWFLFRYEGPNEAITMGDKKEFSNWEWLSMKELVSRVVPFKKSVYQELAEQFSDILYETT